MNSRWADPDNIDSWSQLVVTDDFELNERALRWIRRLRELYKGQSLSAAQRPANRSHSKAELQDLDF